MVLPAGSCFPKLLPSGRLLSLPALVAIPASHGLPQRSGQAAPPQRPSLQLRSAPRSVTCSSAPRLLLPIGALAGNKPHPAEKSTPVWLAIWRTWAGFANSQLLPDAAAFSSIQGPPRSGNSSAQTSASLHPSRSASLAGPPIHEDMVVHGLC